MNLPRFILATFAALLLFIVIAAQTPRRGATSRPPTQKPAASPAPTAAPSPTPKADPASPSVAIIEGTAISASDIEGDVSAAIMRDADPYLRDYYADPVKAINEARQRAVDARVNSMLVAAEAKKRGKTANDFIETEINTRVANPTEQEIKAAYDANRNQIGNADLESVRAELVNFIRNQRKEELYGALVNRLKMTNVVSKTADVNTPNLAPGTVLVSVNGDPLRVDAINTRMKAYTFKMQMRIYALRKDLLDRKINDMLIVSEANKRKVGPEEIIRTEVTEKLKAPTETEVSKFYEANKANIKTDLAGARMAIITYLQQEQQELLEVALANKLRTSAKLQLLLREPEAPVLNINPGTGASRGDVNSPVTVVEFTDFQCSACGGMYPIAEDVLKSYGTRVHFVMRNFPLTTVHPNAYNAAQAAEAAKAQGKFWEYIDLLFKNQNTLDRDSLKKYASQAGLDRKQFDAEFDSAKYEPVVRHDMEDGDGYGVEATPTFFINGVMLTDFSGEGLRAAIEKAFVKAGRRP